MSPRLAVAGLIALAPGVSLAEDAAPSRAPGVLLRDEFDGRFHLNWQPLRPEPSHFSLSKRPGALTITTQRGSIHGDETTDPRSEGRRAKNLFLVDNPLADDADFVITARVTGFTPGRTYQQAGLLIHEDDDNYVKWNYEYDWERNGGQSFLLVREEQGGPRHTRSRPFPALNDYRLRLTRRRDEYECAVSFDGVSYEALARERWGGRPVRVGLIAKNGGEASAPEDDAHFEFFEFRSLPHEAAP